MLKFTSWVIGLLLLSTHVVNAQPKKIQLEYEVARDDKPFATVKESFIQEGATYRIESITKGLGIYALFGERKLNSAGEVTAEGLKPLQFELRQGDNPKKTIQAAFDWGNQTLNTQAKGKTKTLPLLPSTQDLASYAYQFMFMANALTGTFNMPLTTGKKINQYTYVIQAEPEVLSLLGQPYKTIHLTPPVSTAQAASQSDVKELWLSLEHHYLPVKIMLTDEHGQKLVQTLTSLQVE
ncbi:MAG: DUF3108 domain-containing protein [Methylotenera sp.]|nr:DUF3108 domain-containing protein [Methylotenera sp.]